MLSARSVDAWWTFVLPGVCVVSLLSNAVCALVLARVMRKNANKIFAYMWVKSVAAALYLLICSFVFAIKCNSFVACAAMPAWLQLVAKLYELYLYNYLSSSLALFDLCIETMIALERLFAIMSSYRRTSSGGARRRTSSALALTAPALAVSLAFYLPNLVVFELRQTQPQPLTQTANETTISIAQQQQQQQQQQRYYLGVRDPTMWPTYSLFIRASVALRCLFVLVLLLAINALTFNRFNKRITIKRMLRVTSTGKLATKSCSLLVVVFLLLLLFLLLICEVTRVRFRFNMMISCQCTMLIVCNVFIVTSYVILARSGTSQSPYYRFLIPSCNTLVFVSHGLSLLLYAHFNTEFRQTLSSTFRPYCSYC